MRFCQRDLHASCTENVASGPDRRINDFRSRSSLSFCSLFAFFVVIDFGLTLMAAHIKNPHDERERAGFQLGNEVVSAHFSEKQNIESRRNSRTASRDFRRHRPGCNDGLPAVPGTGWDCENLIGVRS